MMNWEQIRELSQSRLIEVVSHSFDLHRGIQYNPQGNVGPAVNVRAYDPRGKRYETKEEYLQRLRNDFINQKILFKRQLGFYPRAIVWPYGKYNEISVEIAKEQGCQLTFTLEEGLGHLNRLDSINRILVENPGILGNLYIRDFIKQVKTIKILMLKI